MGLPVFDEISYFINAEEEGFYPEQPAIGNPKIRENFKDIWMFKNVEVYETFMLTQIPRI